MNELGAPLITQMTHKWIFSGGILNENVTSSMNSFQDVAKLTKIDITRSPYFYVVYSVVLLEHPNKQHFVSYLDRKPNIISDAEHLTTSLS